MSSNITRIADSRTVQKAMVGRKMNKSEATELTARIRQTAGTLWQLVAEAHDRKAWAALGYESWKDYIVTELQMSESRSYQLVRTGRVMRAIAEVTGDAEVLSTTVVTARETAKVIPHLTTFKKELRKAIGDGMGVQEAVQEAIYELPGGRPAPKTIEGEVVDPKQADWERRLAEAQAAQRRDKKATTKTEPKICTHCHGTGYIS